MQVRRKHAACEQPVQATPEATTKVTTRACVRGLQCRLLQASKIAGKSGEGSRGAKHGMEGSGGASIGMDRSGS